MGVLDKKVLDSKDSGDEDSVLFNDGVLEFDEASEVEKAFFSPGISGLAEAAEELGKNSTIMEMYWQFQQGAIGWFFSPNPHLESATRKPNYFSSWDGWKTLSTKQKSTIAVLAGFKEDCTNIFETKTDLEKLVKGYKNWKKELYSVFWANTNSGVWTCNIFVGDAIYLWKKKSVTYSNKHYYDPNQIKTNQGPFKKIKASEVKRGTIVVFGSSHVEIITSLEKFGWADDGFCSIGAGRSSRVEIGIIKCDEPYYPSDKREIYNENNTYYTL